MTAELQQGPLLVGRAFGRLLAHSVEKVVHSYAELSGESPEPSNGDAVLAGFIFVHLLRCEPNQIAQILLGHPQQDPPLAQPGPDMAI